MKMTMRSDSFKIQRPNLTSHGGSFKKPRCPRPDRANMSPSVSPFNEEVDDFN